MPVDAELAQKVWSRYAWCRDNGHADFVLKADTCSRNIRGEQWRDEDTRALKAAKRPFITVNKILPTLANVMGEQIKNRNEISYRPAAGAPAETAEVLAKVYKQISQNNQLDWVRSDVFQDGIGSSRGFFDVRIEMNDHVQGEVRITRLNPKNVVVDCDAEDYDPDMWSDVSVTKWMTIDDIAAMYSKEDAEYLKGRDHASFMYGSDSVQAFRDRFGKQFMTTFSGGYAHTSMLRNLRVIDHQHRQLDTQQMFVAHTGDMRPVPANFDRDRIAWYVEKFGFNVIKKFVRRIRWTVVCDNVVLHDEWSPYKHFTVVPYFPYFMHGHTVGLAENLLGAQELLNKSLSQELHVVNTTANSGYIVRTGTLTNMSIGELEKKGAQTGLVLEVNDDPQKAVQKITPNQIPSGLDRLSYKAEEHIKGISGISDSMQGFDREDVAAKAIQAKKQAGSTNLVSPLDKLARTDFILARNILDCIQGYYTEERLLTITKNSATGETETFGINQVTPEGTVANDLTIGEYDVVVTSVPVRDTLEDSQFEQAMAMREQGIMIPDSVIIEASRLMNKKEIIKLIEGDQDSPEAKAQKALQERAQNAEVSKVEGEAAAKHADAALKAAKAHREANTPPDTGGDGNPELEMAQANHETSLKEREFARDTSLKFMELNLKKQAQEDDTALKAQDMAQKREDARVEQARRAAQEAQQPKPKQGATQ